MNNPTDNLWIALVLFFAVLSLTFGMDTLQVTNALLMMIFIMLVHDYRVRSKSDE